MMRTRRLAHIAIVLLACLSTVAAYAGQVEAYPRKPLRLIVGFTPAAATDLFARALAVKLAEQMKNPVVVENRPGAGGNIAYDIGSKATPDGHTFIFNTGGLVQNYALQSKPSYHPLRDFAPVAMVSKSPLLLVASTSVPTGSIAEFIAHAKANPGKLNYSSAGQGNITHLGNVLFQQAVGITATHVPYSGSAPALIDVMAGRVQYTTPTVSTAMPFLKDKRVKPLVVMSLKRSPALPEVPTADETVAPKFEVASWLGVLAPAGTPPAIVKRINAELLTALNDSELRSRLLATGADIVPSTPENYGAYIRAELDRWTRIIKGAGLSLE